MIETAIFTSAEGNGTRWRLTGVADPSPTWHYVELRFDVAGGEVLGYLVSRATGEEDSLDDVRFNGTSLSFRLPSVVGGRRVLAPGFERSPRCALGLVGDREFRGYYVDEQDARLDRDHELKLVKVQDDVISL